MHNRAYRIMASITVFLLLGNITYAYDMNEAVSIVNAEHQNEWQREQHRIREYRLQQWNEQQRNLQPTNNNQVISRQQASVAPQVEPEADELFAAAINGNVNQISSLLSRGLDINISNAERETSLHMAAARGHYSAVIYLVKHGAYVNAKTVKNWIPLHHAVRFKHPNIVNFLMKRGSVASSRTSDGLSAIDMARSTQDYRLLSLLGAQ